VYDERQVRSARICGMVWQQQTSTPDSNQPEPNDGGPYPSGGSIVVLLPIVGTLPPSAGRLSALFGLLVRAAAVVHWAPCRLVRRLTSLPPARQTAGPLQRPDWEATQSAAIRWIEVPPLLSVHLFTWLKAERERERDAHARSDRLSDVCVAALRLALLHTSATKPQVSSGAATLGRNSKPTHLAWRDRPLGHHQRKLAGLGADGSEKYLIFSPLQLSPPLHMESAQSGLISQIAAHTRQFIFTLQ